MTTTTATTQTESGQMNWRYAKWSDGYVVFDRYNNLIATGIQTEETAAEIVNAVNDHAALASALEDCVSLLAVANNAKNQSLYGSSVRQAAQRLLLRFHQQGGRLDRKT